MLDIFIKEYWVSMSGEVGILKKWDKKFTKASKNLNYHRPSIMWTILWEKIYEVLG